MWCLIEFKTFSKEIYCSCKCEKNSENSPLKDNTKKGVAALLSELTFSLLT
jgi:hypothetical protein